MSKKMYPSEKQFADYLTAQGKTWAYEPKAFDLGIPRPQMEGNITYTPDFYCFEDDIYYEVLASRSACSQRRKKIRLFKKQYSNIKFKTVNPNGTIFNNGDLSPKRIIKTKIPTIKPKEIKKIREKVGGHMELARRVGVRSESQIYRWERGVKPHEIYEKKLREIEKELE